MKFCPHCNRELEATMNFCPGCGKRVDVQEPSAPYITIAGIPWQGPGAAPMAPVDMPRPAEADAMSPFRIRGITPPSNSAPQTPAHTPPHPAESAGAPGFRVKDIMPPTGHTPPCDGGSHGPYHGLTDVQRGGRHNGIPSFRGDIEASQPPGPRRFFAGNSNRSGISRNALIVLVSSVTVLLCVSAILFFSRPYRPPVVVSEDTSAYYDPDEDTSEYYEPGMDEPETEYGTSLPAYRLINDSLYQDAGDFHEGLAAVKVDGLYGYINKNGEMAINNQYEYAGNFREGYAAVKFKDYWYFIDTAGNSVIEIPAEYSLAIKNESIDSLSMFYRSNAVILKSTGRFGIGARMWDFSILTVDANGQYAFRDYQEWYAKTFMLRNGLVLAAESAYGNGIFDFIDPSTGAVVNRITASSFLGMDELDHNDVVDNDVFVFRIQGKGGTGNAINWICTDDRGNTIYSYEEIDREFLTYSEGFIVYQNYPMGGDCGYWSIGKSKGTDLSYQNARDFRNGLAAVQTSGLYGYINTDYTMVIEPKFNSALDFSEGLAPVERRGVWGYINTDGEYVIEPTFDEASVFISGVAFVKQNGQYGVINAKGEFVVAPSLDEDQIEIKDGHVQHSEGLVRIRLDGQYCFFDLSKKTIKALPEGAFFMRDSREGRALVSRDYGFSFIATETENSEFAVTGK